MAQCLLRCILLVAFLCDVVYTAQLSTGVDTLPTTTQPPQTSAPTGGIETNQKPVCPEQVNITRTKAQQVASEPIYCFNTTNSPCTDPDNGLNYTVVTTNYKDVLSQENDCFIQLTMDLTQPRYCITIFATETESETPQSDTFELCVTFNEAPTFGGETDPRIVNIKLLQKDQSIKIPVNTNPDSIALFELTDVTPNSFSRDFGVTDETQAVITYTKPSSIASLVNVTLVDITVNVTEDGNPPLSSQADFTIVLINDEVTCSNVPTVLHVDTDNANNPVAVVNCQSSAGNQLSYTVDVLSSDVSGGTPLEMSASATGELSVATSSQVADFNVRVTALSIYNVQKSFNVTVSAGHKPNCTVDDYNLLVKSSDPEDTIYVNFTCVTDGSNLEDIDFEILDVNEDNFFDVDSSSTEDQGKALGYAVISLNNVYVEATFPTSVTVKVTNVYGERSLVFPISIDNTPPRFTDTATEESVLETAPSGQSVYTFQATDGESADIIFSIQDASDASAVIPFTIDGNGSLSTDGRLNASLVSSYLLTVTVTDPDGLSARRNFTVTVTDVNDPPQCNYAGNDVTVILDITASIGQSVVTLDCQDNDVTQAYRELNYTITGTSAFPDFFGFNASNSEEIILLKSLETVDVSTTPSTSFTVTVADKGSPSLSVDLTVTISFSDKRPVCSQNTLQYSLPEKTDMTSCFNLSHSCSDPTSEGLNFALSELEGDQSSLPLDPYFGLGDNSADSMLSYVTICITQDINGHPGVYVANMDVSNNFHSTTMQLTITVTDVNEPPVIADLPSDKTFTISETSPTQTPVATLNISDPDPGNNGVLSFTFEAADPSIGSAEDFTFNEGSLSIVVAQSLNATRQNSYVYTLTVKDGGGLSETVNLTITVNDVNEAPHCEQPEDFTVNATTGPDSVIGYLTCWDNDLMDEYKEIVYTIQQGVQPVLINVTSDGELVLLDSIPYEYNRLVYTVTVGNRLQGDSPGPSINITVTIIYNKEFPPVCNATSMVVNFLDTDSPGCGVGKVKCTSPLQGAPSIIEQSNLTDNFEIKQEEDESSISLRICAKSDFKDDIGIYEVKTVVTNGLRNATVVWNVTVTDVNEAPYFQHSSYYRDLPQNTANGTTFAVLEVLTVPFTDTDAQTWEGFDAIRVTDPDVHTELNQIKGLDGFGSYKFKENGTTIESSSLPIIFLNSEFKVNGILDESLIYLFRIEVSDGKHTVSVVYTINITDINDPPTCNTTSLEFNVSLLIKVDTPLDTIYCSDPDYDADKMQTIYTLDGPNKDNFQISSSGEIKTKTRLPRDQDILTFKAVASDGANSSLAYVIDITVNVDRVISATCTPVVEYPPVWVINSCLTVDLKCTDPTADDTSSITYTESGNYTIGFNLSGDSGVYSLCYGLKSNGDYKFNVEIDNGLKTTTKTVEISVIYLSSTPNFDQQRYEVNVTESVMVTDTILTVSAVTEGDHTGNITYLITDYAPAFTSSYFNVEERTGMIKADKILSELIRNGTYTVTLTLQATDDFSQLKSSVTVQLNVQEINLEPVCQAVADQGLSINAEIDKKIVKVECTDANYRTEYKTLSYSLQNDYFTVANDGWVSTKTKLPLTMDFHDLRIQVTDGEFVEEVSVSVTVNMEIRPVVSSSAATTTSIRLAWSFAREDYGEIVQRYILQYEPEGQSVNTVIISKDMQGSVLANLRPGTNHQIVLHAVTTFGNFSSILVVARTVETAVLTNMTVRYKDKNTAWVAKFNNPSSQDFKDYARTAEANLNEVLKDVIGLHSIQVIGLSSGSVFVDGVVAVNQTGNISEAAQVFSAGVYSGKIGTTDVDAGIAEIVYQENFVAIDALSLAPGNHLALSEGLTVTLQCPFRLVGVGLTPKVTWSLGGREIAITTTGKFTQTVTHLANDTFGYVATLAVRSVAKRDSGGYICEVEAKEAEVSRSRSLLVTVLEKPIVDLQPLSSYVESRSKVELNCSVLSEEEGSVQFKWYRDNNLISNPPVTQLSPKKQMLTISSALANSAYYCQVQNAAGSTNSETSNIYIIRSDVERCARSTDSHGTEWSSSPVNQLVKMACPEGSDGLLKRKCGSNGEWERANYTGCTLKSLITIQQQVETIEDGIDITEPEDLVDSLENVTASQPLVAGDIDVSINIMERVVNVSRNKDEIKTDFVKNFVNTANNMLNSDKDVWEELEETDDKNGVTSLMKTLETVGQLASEKSPDDDTNSNNEGLTVIATKHIVMAYGKTNLKDIVFPRLEEDQYPMWMQQSKTRAFLRKDSYSSSVPGEMDEATEGLMGYSGLYYKDIDELVDDTQDDSDNTIPDEEKLALSGKKLNSKILSFSLSPHISGKLNPPLMLTFEHVNGNFSSPVCGFLDFSPPYGRRGRWSSRGCEMINSTVNLTVCECDHLTNFAILMSPGRLTAEEAHILSIISAVGCGISLLFLLLTICIYLCLWRYVKSDRAIILINLCVALIIAYSIFLGGVTQTENKDVCTAIAALLHFFFLVVFFLMLAEGVEVLVSVVYVFNTRSRLKWLLALSWGVPLVVVGISLGVTKLEGYGNNEFCWLSLESGLLWAFVAPALAVILANLIIVFIVLKTMFSTTAMMTKTAMEKGRAGLKALCVLLPLMGVTWVFGVFSVNEDLIAFQYLFAVFNSLQGFFIFIFHCLVSRQVQDGMKNRRRRYRAKSFKTTGTESSSQLPASKVNSSSEDDKPANDLDRKVGSPFIEADRQVQQIANKLYPNRENLMDRPISPKSPSKVNVPVDLSDIKLQNASDAPNKFLFPENGTWLTEGHVLLSEEPSIEENDAIIIGSPSTKARNGAPPSPSKTAWGEPDKSAPLHFSDYRLGRQTEPHAQPKSPQKKAGQLPPSRTKPKVTLIDHYDPPPPDILDDPAIQGWNADAEAKLRERKDRFDQIYSVQGTAITGQEDKVNKPNVAKKMSAQSQKSKSSTSSASHKADAREEPEVETIHLYEQRDMPLYRGRNDDQRPSRLKTAADRRRRQQKHHYTEAPRMMVNSEEDLSRYGKRQPFGGIRTSADVGVPGMGRPRQQRDMRWQDPNLQYW